MNPISLNIAEVKQKFNEIYQDPQEAYLWPTFLLGYSAYLFSKVPDLAIPGQDPHVIVAVLLGRITCEIEKENKKFMERCHNDDGFVNITNQPKRQVSSQIEW